MRKFILVSTLVLSSSVAFAQFTGPTVERESQPRQDYRGQMQNHPYMNNQDGQPCHYHQKTNQRHNGQWANGPRRQHMNQTGYHQNNHRGEHRQYHNNGPRHEQYNRTNHRNGEMRQHPGNRQQMHQNRHSDGNRQMHRGQSRHNNARW